MAPARLVSAHRTAWAFNHARTPDCLGGKDRWVFIKDGWIEPTHVAEVIAFLSDAGGQGVTDTCIEVTGIHKSPGVRAL